MKMNMKIKREDWIKGGNAPLIGWMTEKERDVKFSISSALLCPYLCYFLSLSLTPKMSLSHFFTTHPSISSYLLILNPSHNIFYFPRSAGGSSRRSRSRGRQDHRWVDCWYFESSNLCTYRKDRGSDHTSTGKLMHAIITMRGIFILIDLLDIQARIINLALIINKSS